MSLNNSPKLKAAIENWKSQNGSTFRNLPYAKIIEEIFGENSVFFVGENYHNGYHDDYCTIQYYCNATGEFFDDEWTSAFVCPPYDTYKECKTYKQAQEERLIDIKTFNDNWKCDPSFILDYVDMQYGAELFYNNQVAFAFVEVIRGIKVKKGTKGIWFNTVEVPVWNGYKDYAIILTDDGEIVKVNLDYLKLQKNFVEDIVKYLNDGIAKEMEVTDRQRSYDITKNINEYIENTYGDIIEEAQEKYSTYRLEEERKLYYPSERLITWVKDKFPELNDEEVIEKGIYINKKNGNKNRN